MKLRRGATGILSVGIFVGVFAAHALYIRHVSSMPADGWADSDLLSSSDPLGFGPYLQSQDFYTSFSYALGAAFAVWAIAQFLRSRRAAMAAGAAGSVTAVGILMAAGCFLVGCCGSPMLGVYASIFGAKALGVGKPLMAGVTLLSTGWGYWYLSRRATSGCTNADCGCAPASEVFASSPP